MGEYAQLKRTKLLELFGELNRENDSDNKGIALREIDITSLEKVRSRLIAAGQKVTYSAFIVKVAAMALKEFPQINRVYLQKFFYSRLVQLSSTHISIAVERADASPGIEYENAFIYTVFNSDQKKVFEITNEMAGLATTPLTANDPRLERWKSIHKALKTLPIWLIRIAVWFQKNLIRSYIKNRGGSLMISSPSKYGVDFIVAAWPYPLGMSFGLAKERPWVVNGELAVRKTMTLTLAFDRRVVSGSLAARFLNRISEILEDAESYPELG